MSWTFKLRSLIPTAIRIDSFDQPKDRDSSPMPEREDVLIEPLVIKDGAFALPTKPGLGIELNKEVFDQYVYKPRDLDHFTPAREIIL